MRVETTPKFPVTPEATLKQTGKTTADWVALADKKLGPKAGRKEVGDFFFKEMKVDPWWTTTLVVAYEAAHGMAEKDGRPRGYNICVTKSITAPPEKVFAAIEEGSWAKPETTVTVEKATPGKMFRCTLSGPGHPAGETVEIKITPSGGKCALAVMHERIQDRGRADGLREAWAGILNGWKGSLE